MATSIVKAVVGGNAAKKAASQQAASAAEASRIEGEKPIRQQLYKKSNMIVQEPIC